MAVRQQWPTTSSSAPVSWRRAVCCMLRTCGRASSLGLLLCLRCQLGCLPLQATCLGVEGLALALKHCAAHRLREQQTTSTQRRHTSNKKTSHLNRDCISLADWHYAWYTWRVSGAHSTGLTECLAMTDSPKLRPQSSHFTMGSSSSTTGSMGAATEKQSDTR